MSLVSSWANTLSLTSWLTSFSWWPEHSTGTCLGFWGVAAMWATTSPVVWFTAAVTFRRFKPVEQRLRLMCWLKSIGHILGHEQTLSGPGCKKQPNAKKLGSTKPCLKKNLSDTDPTKMNHRKVKKKLICPHHVHALAALLSSRDVWVSAGSLNTVVNLSRHLLWAAVSGL